MVAVSAVFDFANEHHDQFDLIEWVCFDKNTLRYYSRQIELRNSGYYE
jgi:hypothetical protein